MIILGVTPFKEGFAAVAWDTVKGEAIATGAPRPDISDACADMLEMTADYFTAFVAPAAMEEISKEEKGEPESD